MYICKQKTNISYHWIGWYYKLKESNPINLNKMKTIKLMITLMMCLFMVVSYGQWTYKTIDNGFDEPFKKAYTAINNGGFLGMETSEELKTTIEYPDSIVGKRDSI